MKLITWYCLLSQIETGRSLGTNDLTLTKLKQDGFSAVFVGIGMLFIRHYTPDFLQ